MIEANKIYVGDCIEIMKTWPDNFVDTIITDPPYGIGFMGKAWDSFEPDYVAKLNRQQKHKSELLADGNTRDRFASASSIAGGYNRSVEANREFQTWCCAWATEALRIAKPGALMLVSGGTRTFHRMTAGLEDAGWQIRDCLMWLYGSGFPKSLDISKAIDKAKGTEREVIGKHESFRPNTESHVNGKYAGEIHTNGNITAPASDLSRQWSGWGTALKPAWEPIIVAMKPLDGTFAENAEKWGVAGINVDGGRIASGSDHVENCDRTFKSGIWAKSGEGKAEITTTASSLGRWPANLILDEDAAAMLDGQSGASVSQVRKLNGNETKPPINAFGDYRNRTEGGVSDSGGASRFFYVAKSAKAERNEGCDGMEEKPLNWSSGTKTPGSFQAEGTKRIASNNHPTVKPLGLMKYLCMLTKTPTGGIVLDPFAGSGTTLWAAEFHNRPWLGIEMNPEYVAIANARIARERSQIKMAI